MTIFEAKQEKYKILVSHLFLMSFSPIFNLHLSLVMSVSDSSLNLSFSSDSDDEFVFSEDLYENVLFYLICLEPSTFKLSRTFTGIKDRICSLNFINSWTDEMFYRQFLRSYKFDDCWLSWTFR